MLRLGMLDGIDVKVLMNSVNDAHRIAINGEHILESPDHKSLVVALIRLSEIANSIVDDMVCEECAEEIRAIIDEHQIGERTFPPAPANGKRF